jgi:hypothetical protein
MTENEAREIAQKYVDEKSYDECVITSVRKLSPTGNLISSTLGDEWVVQFQFRNDGSYAAEYLYIAIDDATCEPRSLDCL